MKTNHPWLTIIHPGPWTRLPPAQAPVPTPRSKHQRTWYKARVPAPNPFEEAVDEEEDTKPEPAGQTKPSAAATCSQNGGSLGGCTNTVSTSRELARDTSQIGESDLGETGNSGSLLEDVTGAAGPPTVSGEAQSRILPRSLSVPAITPSHSQQTEANDSDQVPSCQSKV